MTKKIKLTIFVILLIGVIYRLWITWDNNFLFTMDNARDAIDVREMVVLHKLRLIGPTSGIEGLYDGPAWYYFIAIGFLFTGGNPYASVLLMVLLWVIGGYYLLKITSRFGLLPMVTVGSIWVASDYVVLANRYAFNPNPLLLLMPVFIYWMEHYLKKNSLIGSFLIWFLTGLFFNFEMAFGIFMPLVILFAIFTTGKACFLKTKNFWIGWAVFILLLLPQIIFNFKHNSLLVNSLLTYIHQGATQSNILLRAIFLLNSYKSVLTATMMNFSWLVNLSLLIILLTSALLVKGRRRDDVIFISASLLLIPFVGYLFLHINVMPWHLGGAMVATLVLLAYALSFLRELSQRLGLLVSGFCVLIILLSIINLDIPKNVPKHPTSSDESSLHNELLTIDYVYKNTSGKNFKVYTYLPSVIDYPSQYLFWWYGQKRYGYIPLEYAYAPNKPEYIKYKDKYSNGNNPPDSGLVFLIEQQDDPRLFDLWKNNFTNFKVVTTDKVGPYIIETRTQI